MKPTVVRRVPPKPIKAIAAEWDLIAAERAGQLDTGIDLSYDHVIVPEMLALAARQRPKRSIDVGCGVGRFTSQLATVVPSVVGIDPSKTSIAEATASHNPQVDFVIATAEQFARRSEGFDLVVANLVIMDAPNLNTFVASLAELCSPGGRVLISLLHPWFWSQYWDYASCDWFRYVEEIFIEASFTISQAVSHRTTTHIHRPLGRYTAALEKNGLHVCVFSEPMPSADIELRYPEPWHFPRFLILEALRVE